MIEGEAGAAADMMRPSTQARVGRSRVSTASVSHACEGPQFTEVLELRDSGHSVVEGLGRG